MKKRLVILMGLCLLTGCGQAEKLEEVPMTTEDLFTDAAWESSVEKLAEESTTEVEAGITGETVMTLIYQEGTVVIYVPESDLQEIEDDGANGYRFEKKGVTITFEDTKDITEIGQAEGYLAEKYPQYEVKVAENGNLVYVGAGESNIGYLVSCGYVVAFAQTSDAELLSDDELFNYVAHTAIEIGVEPAEVTTQEGQDADTDR
jgi:hypothetical protein